MVQLVALILVERQDAGPHTVVIDLASVVARANAVDYRLAAGMGHAGFLHAVTLFAGPDDV